MSSTPPKDTGLKRCHVEDGNTPCKPPRTRSRKILHFTPPSTNLSGNRPDWSEEELGACINFCEMKTYKWPCMRAKSPFWKEASDYISKISGCDLRSAAAVRAKVTKSFAKCESFEYARLQVQNESSPRSANSSLDVGDSFMVTNMTCSQIQKMIDNSIQNLSLEEISSVIQTIFSKLNSDQTLSLLDSLFQVHAEKDKIKGNPSKFISKSLSAMSRLVNSGHPNSLYNFAHILATERMSLDRMPWSMIEHQIEFFKATNNQQLKVPEPYVSFLQTLSAEFPSRLMRLLNGPMWSGLPKEDHGDPLKARVNIAGISRSSLTRKAKDLPFTDTPVIQVEALKTLQKGGRYWIKLDGTDIKGALQESQTGEWNGDEDIMDSFRDSLRIDYLKMRDLCVNNSCVQRILDSLQESLDFFRDGLSKSSQTYSIVSSSRTVSQEKLKIAAWDCVEWTTLLKTCQKFITDISFLVNEKKAVQRIHISKLQEEWKDFVSKLFKKKRKMATHILVIMVSNEKRNSKPYALPVQFIPYISMHDQHVRDHLTSVKTALVQNGLIVVGTVTDGEFHTLRTRGETRALHIWQLVHDSRQAVGHKSANTLRGMLTFSHYDQNGIPVAHISNDVIPSDVLLRIYHLSQQTAWTNAVETVRAELVPVGQQPFPYRKGVPESFLDKMRTILATYLFRREIRDWTLQGCDFQHHLYVPEMDPLTGTIAHDRGDHCHILKRIATSTREGKYQALDLDRFDEALLEPTTGLTHAALVGIRKQSVIDAEKLLSYSMTNFMAARGYDVEAEYLDAIASWHEASDGRGISQLNRCRNNYKMLNYLLDELMPWHKETYDFSLMDTNRPMDNIRGFTYQTFIEVTANIESQEYRRLLNEEIGFEEHPRSGTTDDVEAFFSLVRRHLGGTFTLKEFRYKWRQLVCEFVKRTANDLPFWVWTLNERYVADYGSFDDGLIHVQARGDHNYHHNDDEETHRLHMVQRCTREDASIFVAGRAFLPVRNRTHIRQRLYRPEAALPPVPPGLLPQAN